MPPTYATLLVADDAARGARTLTLNRPERRNALGPETVGELLEALAQAFADESVRVVVLAGAGKAFCAGGDFGQMSGSSTPLAEPRGDYADLLLALARAPKPVVARVHGAAFGGGLGLVASSTFAIAAEGAELGTPEINVGLFPMMIMAVLTRLVPRRRLLEMMLLGERLKADEALAYGLVNRVVPAGDLDAAVGAICDQLAQKSPAATRLGLAAFYDQDTLALAEAVPLLRDRLSACLATDDAREGLTAFLEKRPPRFTGR
jgi:enoyl-CoA hydratase/carnithine racemase